MAGVARLLEEMSSRRPVIVGAGTAGLAAAVTAGEVGRPVTLVEKTDRVGGMLQWSSGHFSAAGTRRQRARGITDSPDLHYRDVMAMGHGRNDPALVRLAVETLPDTVDWLEGLGFSFSPATPALVSGHEVYSRPRTYWGGDDPVSGGLEILRTLLAHIDETLVDMRLETAVTRIVVDGSQGLPAVRGLEVEHDGQRELIETSCVILAAGGYAANRVLLAELQPEHAGALTGCMDHATGDAHEMLSQLGVELIGCDAYVPTMGMIEDPDRPGWGLRLTEARLIVDATQRAPWEIWVNRDGERFVNEATESPYEREQALLGQPDLAMFSIWDRTVVERASPPIGPDRSWDAIEVEVGRGRWLHRADGLHELAEQLGVDRSGLERTAATFGPEGPDPFDRIHRPVRIERPPYYGVRTTGGMLLSRGGPRVDEGLRPLDSTGTAIRGLYAVGELLGMTQFSGDSFAGGMSVGPALAFGRLVMQRAASALD